MSGTPFLFVFEIPLPLALSFQATPLPYRLIGMVEAMSPSHLVLLLGFGVQVLLQLDAQFLAQGLELLEVLLVLLLVLNLGLDAYGKPVSMSSASMCLCVPVCTARFVPSKIRTAVGKSLTLRAALSAAVQTPGEGTRS